MKTEPHPLSEFVFSTRSGMPQTYETPIVNKAHRLQNRRSRGPVPLLRHQWATHTFVPGGSVALLRRQLGHSSLETVLFYEHLATSDLSNFHERYSLLASSAI